jgi:hypothetical protein
MAAYQDALNWEWVWLVIREEYDDPVVGSAVPGEYEVRKFEATHHPETKEWVIKVRHSLREVVSEDKVYRTKAAAVERMQKLKGQV